MTARGTVVVTSRSFGDGSSDPAATLAEHGLAVARGPADHDPAALSPLLRDAVAWIAGAGPVADEHLRLAPALRIVARYGTGVDAVDLDAARRRRVVVTNTPGANAGAVAEHTIALTLACLRRIVAADRHVRAGRWPAVRGRELGASTVGLVGFGDVGRRVAAIVHGFGGTVVVHDPFVDATGITSMALDALLERADVVSLHCPPTAAPVITADALRRMRPGAVLINTARASLLDEDAVAAALRRGSLGALGSDVLSGSAALLAAPRTVFTPHCAAQTDQAIDRMGHTAVAEVLRVVVHRTAPLHRVA
jgi:D-3-phosphoglycerate dehydrogenase